MGSQVMAEALKQLGRQTMATRKLTEKLLQADFDAAAVEECVARLRGWGYLDDRQFGIDRLRSLQIKLKSRRYIEEYLLHSGLEPLLVGDLLAECYPETLELDVAKKALTRKFSGKPHSTVQMIQYLFRAGFSEDTVGQCFPDRSST
jgi:SOS response regulatory protein OraA/RecX